jgi:hypothetical protein
VEPSSSTFLTSPIAARRSAALQLAWVDAADDVHETYAEWLRAERAERANTFTAYQAALDREQAAARALELQSHAVNPCLRPS